MVRILVADADPTMRKSLALLLNHKFGLTQVAEAATAEDLAHQLQTAPPDLVIADWPLIKANLPGPVTLSPNTRLVILSLDLQAAIAAQVLGATFIHKAAPAQQVLEQLKTVIPPQNNVGSCPTVSPQARH